MGLGRKAEVYRSTKIAFALGIAAQRPSTRRWGDLCDELMERQAFR